MIFISDSDTGEEETDEGFFVDVTEVQIKKNPAIRTLSVSGPPIRAQKHNHIHGKLLHKTTYHSVGMYYVIENKYYVITRQNIFKAVT